ncbi:MarR family transcriptional regulator [Saccharopolyspora elongata]|uniref:MarR family transcriptional regulator n=1 Tax=Saccharopolyspora elongata TaxID=2530387 RepID=A0A4R4ZAQ3_9PSEU|nr:MarR family transcriptional regulator [Saccharopolyspora elongata]
MLVDGSRFCQRVDYTRLVSSSELSLAGALSRAFAVVYGLIADGLREDGFRDHSPAQGVNVLRNLGEEPRSVGRLASMTGVSKQAISRQVAGLERAGYVRTEPDPADGRGRLVHLTDRGREEREVAQERVARLRERLERELGPDETETFLRGLEVIIGWGDREKAAKPDRGT